MSTARQTFRVGLIGAGYVSQHHIRALQSLPYVQVLGVCDTDYDRALTAQKRFGLPAAFRDWKGLAAAQPDVIHVLTPPSSHCLLTMQALAMGCHVFVEKPMAVSTEECDRMITAARQAKRVLSVNHSARMDPVVLEALRRVKSGACGSILAVDFIRSSEYAPYSGGPIPIHCRDAGYPFLDVGIHGLSLCEAFLGPIRDIHVRHASSGRDPHLTFDEWHALVGCEQGAGHIYVSCNVHPFQNELIIHGTRGVLHVDCYLQTCAMRKQFPAPKMVQRTINALSSSIYAMGKTATNVLRFAFGRLLPSPGINVSVRAFYDALRKQANPPVSAEEGRRAVFWATRATRAAVIDKERLLKSASSVPTPARILVTGGTGFLGRALVARLIENGESIRVLARRPVAEFAESSHVHVMLGDLGDPDTVDRAVQGVELVYHLGAATKGDAASFESATIWGTKNIVSTCLRHNIKRLVHVSSLAVLDHAGHKSGDPVVETSPLEPYSDLRGAYTRSKLLAERIVMDAVRDDNLPAVILRPAQIFGPGARQWAPSGAITLGRRWIVIGTGSRPLHLNYVEDVVDALLLAAMRDGICGHIFHLVDQQIVTQKDYIDACRRKFGLDLKVTYLPKMTVYATALGVEFLATILRRPLPLSRYRVRSLAPLSPLDGSAAAETLGWIPAVGTHEGLRRTFGIGKITVPANPLYPASV